jgi:predicted nucleotidyltransferase
MKNVDQKLQEALTRIVRTLDASGRGYCLIGALVPRLLMLTPPTQRTRDVDVVVAATSVEDVEELTRTLLSNGYRSVAPPVRFRDESGVQVDVIPFGEAIAPDQRLARPGNTVLRTEGLRQALDRELPAVAGASPSPTGSTSCQPAERRLELLRVAARCGARKARKRQSGSRRGGGPFRRK